MFCFHKFLLLSFSDGRSRRTAGPRSGFPPARLLCRRPGRTNGPHSPPESPGSRAPHLYSHSRSAAHFAAAPPVPKKIQRKFKAQSVYHIPLLCGILKHNKSVAKIVSSPQLFSNYNGCERPSFIVLTGTISIRTARSGPFGASLLGSFFGRGPPCQSPAASPS